MLNPKEFNPFKRGKDKVHSRTRYLDPSQKFSDWVNSLGVEKSWIGRLFYFFDSNLEYRQVLLISLFCLILGHVMFIEIEFPYRVKVGEVSKSDIKSPISAQFPNAVTTEMRRIEAERSISPVFDYDPSAIEGVQDNVNRSFRAMRSLMRQISWSTSDSGREEIVRDFFQYKEKFSELLGTKVTNSQFQWLAENRFSARVENTIIRTLDIWSRGRVADNLSAVVSQETSQIVVHEVGVAGKPPDTAVKISEIRDLKASNTFEGLGSELLNSFAKKDREEVLLLAHQLMVPNLTFNRKETFERRQKARDSVIPDMVSIKKNQVLVNAGIVIQSHHVMVLNEIADRQAERKQGFLAIVAGALFLILIINLFGYLRNVTTFRLKILNKDIAAMGIVTLFSVFLVKIFLFLADANSLDAVSGSWPAAVFMFGAPIVAGPMLVGLLIYSGEIVLLYTILHALVLSVMIDMNFMFFVVALAAGLTAARWIQSCKKRNDIYWSGVKAGLVASAVILCELILTRSSERELMADILWLVPAGFIGGVLSAIVAMILIPVLESLFNYTTDVKLLELSNLNHPLMQEMVVKAPGTYHHSLAVGSMVEAGANAIGANSLLGKVMAFYHDIGKMEHSQYFVENQRPGYNPHDHISPYMSKTVLVAHVKDGAEIGLRFKLGQPIIDGITQHHGTTLISYFYNKAMEEQGDDAPDIEESEFRYPGPKPQFREAGLLMLADSIEAAARSMDEPTTARLQNLVKNIIQSKFIDGQLDECNLTMRELALVEEAFKRVLIGIYHHRIDYPHMKDGVQTSSPKPKRLAIKKDTNTA